MIRVFWLLALLALIPTGFNWCAKKDTPFYKEYSRLDRASMLLNPQGTALVVQNYANLTTTRQISCPYGTIQDDVNFQLGVM